MINLLLIFFLAGEPVWVASARSVQDEIFPPNAEETAEKQISDRYDQWHRPVRKESSALLSTPTVDRFGYQLSTITPFAWVDASSGIEVFLDGDRDDNYSEAIDIGFNFKFYEHSYDQLYISTNGFITFGSGNESFSNRLIPEDTPPNNLIAPFWDDLDLGDGHVFYKLRNQGGMRSLVVEWDQISLYGSNDHLSFEVILYESGDILFQYLSVEGSLDQSSVGIEDGDGIDGLMYLYNSPGLSAGTTVRFIRPGPAPRLKVMPLYQSGFVMNRTAAFQIEITNTNNAESDIYNLSATPSHPGWLVTYQRLATGNFLSDTDGDGKADTGSIPPGESRSILVKTLAQGNTHLGDFSKISIHTTSSNNPAKSQDVLIQVASPAAYAQAYADSSSGVFLGLSSRYRSADILVDEFFTGNTLSLTSTNQGQFIYSWERNGEKNTGGGTAYYSNIEYAVMNGFGEKSQPGTSITKNENLATPMLLVNARYPALASMPNGSTGVLWAQYLLDLETFQSNSNIFFAVLDASGKVVAGPLNVTNNDAWGGQGQDAVPVFSAPQVASTTNHFFLSWSEVKQTEQGEISNLVCAIYSAQGNLVEGPQTYVTNNPGVTQNIDPRLTSLSSDRILMAYSIYDQTDQSYSVAYTILNNNGTTKTPATVIPGSSGWRLDAEQYKNGNILIAWTNPATDRIGFVILDGSGEGIVSQPKDLSILVNRLPDYVSVTVSEEGLGVLTWMDAEWKDYLFYALLNENGEVETPPMISKVGQANNPLIQTSFTGHGLATYVVYWRNFIPIVRR